MSRNATLMFLFFVAALAGIVFTSVGQKVNKVGNLTNDQFQLFH